MPRNLFCLSIGNRRLDFSYRDRFNYNGATTARRHAAQTTETNAIEALKKYRIIPLQMGCMTYLNRPAFFDIVIAQQFEISRKYSPSKYHPPAIIEVVLHRRNPPIKAGAAMAAPIKRATKICNRREAKKPSDLYRKITSKTSNSCIQK